MYWTTVANVCWEVGKAIARSASLLLAGYEINELTQSDDKQIVPYSWSVQKPIEVAKPENELLPILVVIAVLLVLLVITIFIRLYFDQKPRPNRQVDIELQHVPHNVSSVQVP